MRASACRALVGDGPSSAAPCAQDASSATSVARRPPPRTISAASSGRPRQHEQRSTADSHRKMAAGGERPLLPEVGGLVLASPPRTTRASIIARSARDLSHASVRVCAIRQHQTASKSVHKSTSTSMELPRAAARASRCVWRRGRAGRQGHVPTTCAGVEAAWLAKAVAVAHRSGQPVRSQPSSRPPMGSEPGARRLDGGKATCVACPAGARTAFESAGVRASEAAAWHRQQRKRRPRPGRRGESRRESGHRTRPYAYLRLFLASADRVCSSKKKVPIESALRLTFPRVQNHSPCGGDVNSQTLPSSGDLKKVNGGESPWCTFVKSEH